MRRMDGDLLIIGAGGKMGPSLARRARRAAQQAGTPHRIIGVSRFSTPGLARALEGEGIEIIHADLLQPRALDILPDAPNVIFMAARKFGTLGQEGLTWAMNSYLPARIAERFANSRIVSFSSGNVYPLSPVAGGGSTENDPMSPVGEYAQSALARERMFQYFSSTNGTLVTILRLNYAVELRYGILLEVGTKVFKDQAIDVTMGVVNVIWQGEANSVCLRSLESAQSPPTVLNLTGPESVSVRWLAGEFGRRFGKHPVITGTEASTALLNNAARCYGNFGYPRVTLTQMIDWVAGWIAAGGKTHGKPTHFEQREGKF